MSELVWVWDKGTVRVWLEEPGTPRPWAWMCDCQKGEALTASQHDAFAASFAHLLGAHA